MSKEFIYHLNKPGRNFFSLILKKNMELGSKL